VLAETATVAQACAVFGGADHALLISEVPADHQSVGDLGSNWSKGELHGPALMVERAREG
jgi:hypothetical protein